MIPADDPDADLLPAARDGDRDALDALQDAMVAIVRGLPRFDGRSKVGTWMHRVATNTCLDELRRRRRRAAEPLPEVEPAADGTPAVDTTATDRAVIDEALATLPPEFRAPVVLRDLLGHDYATIAEMLDLPPGTVRSRIARGRAALAAHLGGNQDHPPRRPTLQP